jgi:hypothetical protein
MATDSAARDAVDEVVLLSAGWEISTKELKVSTVELIVTAVDELALLPPDWEISVSELKGPRLELVWSVTGVDGS